MRSLTFCDLSDNCICYLSWNCDRMLIHDFWSVPFIEQPQPHLVFENIKGPVYPNEISVIMCSEKFF